MQTDKKRLRSLPEEPAEPVEEHSNQLGIPGDMMLFLEQLKQKGYDEIFKATDEGLQAQQHQQTYKPGEVTITELHRFGSSKEAAGNITLYAIATRDGIKGTAISDDDASADNTLRNFIQQVKHHYPVTFSSGE